MEHSPRDGAIGKKPAARCPVDRAPLMEHAVGGVSFSTCGECGGVWLTRAARVAPALDPAALPNASRVAPEQTRRMRKIRVCPGCKAHLVAERLESIEIDRCELCHGVWLDAGEYDAVRQQIEIRHPETDREKPVDSPDGRLAMVVEAVFFLLELIP